MPKLTTIDNTPTWGGLYPLYVQFIEVGNKEQKNLVIDELKKLCIIADDYNRLKKAGVIK